MKLGKQITLGFIAVILIVLAICAGKLVETVDKGTYQIKQAAITGTMSAKMTPGIWFQFFGDIDTWPKAETYFFTKDNDTKGDVDTDTSIEVRFNDGSMCKISGTARIIMPTSPSQAISLVTERGHKTYADVQEKLIKPTLRNVLRSTANLMSARESYSERRLDFITWSRDQIENGVYKTQEETKKVKDLVTGEETWKKVKVIRTEGGVPLHEDNPLAGTGIVLKNFEIKSFIYEKKVQDQIAAQQEARMAVETAKAEGEKAKQEELKAIAQGKKDVAVAKYKKEEEKIRAVVDAQKEKEVAELIAQKDLEVAKLAKQAAAETKQKEILLGQGEAERARLKLAADGALGKKIDALVKIHANYADAYAKRKVPSAYFAGGGSNGISNPDDEFARFMKMMNLSIAKQLSTDMTIKQGAQTK